MSADKIHNETESVKCCTDCGEEKPLSMFGTRRQKRTNGVVVTYLNSECKECRRLRNEKYRTELKLGVRVKKTKRRLDPEAIEKVCFRCDKMLPMSEYHKSSTSSDGRASRCKSCCSGAHLRRSYTTATENDFSAHESKSECDCCGVTLSGSEKQFDHCHESGVYRGTLCRRCNIVEGLLGTPEVAKALYEYMLRNEQNLRG